ncbi:MAG: hypothetical protein Q8L52_03115 [bacterium]|nr:hypothetical protein [bacterium]
MLTKRQDFLLLIAWTAVSAVILYTFSLSLAVSGLFFYVVPLIYLSLKAPYLVKKNRCRGRSILGAHISVWSNFPWERGMD